MQFRKLQRTDISQIVAAFTAIGWDKPASIYETYLAEQERGLRRVWLAFDEDKFAGYVTLKRVSAYPDFANNNIPEISDLNVLPQYRNKGIATKLLDLAEAEALSRGSHVGIGFGLYADYGAAQRLYVKRGYVPDAKGITYNYEVVLPGSTVCVDDDLVLWMVKYL
jgi:GNAT superfamily N-acetyltransferase